MKILAHALLMMTLAATIPSQTINNVGSVPFKGWVRAISQTQPPSFYGVDPSGLWWFNAGGSDGEYDVDIWLDIAPNATRSLAYATSTPWVRPMPQLPNNPIIPWGGWPSCNGVGLLVEVRPSGAGLHVMMHRIIDDASIHINALWYPDEPWMARIWWTASPAPGVAWSQAATPINLTWGDAEIWSPHGVALVPVGGTLPASGYATAFWQRCARRLNDRDSAITLHAGNVTVQ